MSDEPDYKPYERRILKLLIERKRRAGEIHACIDGPDFRADEIDVALMRLETNDYIRHGMGAAPVYEITNRGRMWYAESGHGLAT